MFCNWRTDVVYAAQADVNGSNPIDFHEICELWVSLVAFVLLYPLLPCENTNFMEALLYQLNCTRVNISQQHFVTMSLFDCE